MPLQDPIKNFHLSILFSSSNDHGLNKSFLPYVAPDVACMCHLTGHVTWHPGYLIMCYPT
jgi:hypothetical protein